MRRWLAALLFGLTGCMALSNTDERSFSCRSNDDCTNGHVCMSRGRCAPRDTCEEDSDCATDGSLTCNAGKCGGRQCYDNSYCNGFRCDTRQCLTSCADRSDCAPANDCVAGKCRPAACSTDADCGGYACNGARCATICVADTDCATGFLCNGRLGCLRVACSSADASTQCHGFACGTDGTCLSRCGASTDCAKGLACRAGGCVCDPAACGAYACNGDTRCFTSCSLDTECAAGYSCSNGTCQRCVGTPLRCEQSCFVPGCSEDALGTCSGSATTCAVLGVAYCTENPGCHVE